MTKQKEIDIFVIVLINFLNFIIFNKTEVRCVLHSFVLFLDNYH